MVEFVGLIHTSLTTYTFQSAINDNVLIIRDFIKNFVLQGCVFFHLGLCFNIVEWRLIFQSMVPWTKEYNSIR